VSEKELPFLLTREQRAGLIYLSLDEFSRETSILATDSHGGGHLYCGLVGYVNIKSRSGY